MGKYWTKLWKPQPQKSPSSSTPSMSEKLECALEEIEHLKKRVLLLEHTLHQTLVHPGLSSCNFGAYSGNTEATYNHPSYPTKSLPRYLHTLPPTPNQETIEYATDSPVGRITCEKGAFVKASVRRHRSLVSNESF